MRMAKEIVPVRAKCRFSKSGQFLRLSRSHKIPEETRAGLRAVLGDAQRYQPRRSMPRYTPYLCPEFEIYLGEALEAGSVHLSRFELVLRAVAIRDKALRINRLGIEGIRVLYKNEKNGYGLTSGVIFQPLRVLGFNLRGWAVSFPSGSDLEAGPTCYLARPSDFAQQLLLTSGLRFCSTDENVRKVLRKLQLPLG